MKTVLVVDDDPALRMVMMRVMQKLGYKTIDATNGMEGEHNALRDNPDIILMDLMMPFQDGYETCAKLRQKGYMGHIIMVSAVDIPDTASKAMAHGANDFLVKPVDFDALRERLDAYDKVTA